MATGKRDPVEEIFEWIIKAVASFLKTVVYGIKRLPQKKASFIVLIIWTLIGLGLVRFRFKVWGLLPEKALRYKNAIFISFGLPVFYLYYKGVFFKKNMDKVSQKFINIGFVSTNEGKPQPPILLKLEHDGKKDIYTFKSTIPIAEWKRQGTKIETQFDFHVLKIEPAQKSKQILKLHTIKADHSLDNCVPWSKDSIRINDIGKFEIVLGVGMLQEVICEMVGTPHFLIAGVTGSGKSVLMRCLTWQCIYKGARVYMVDFKAGTEMGLFKEFGEVAKDRKRTSEILEYLVKENNERLAFLEKQGLQNIEEYNAKYPEQRLSRVVLIIDEAAELLDTMGLPKEEKAEIQTITGQLSTLARLGRAAAINIIMATQRPEANIIPGQIKGMLQNRVSGAMRDEQNSKMVIGDSSAAYLQNIKGRFLYNDGGVETIEFQSYYFKPEYIESGSRYTVGRMLVNSSSFTPKEEIIEPEDEVNEVNIQVTSKSKINLNLDYKKVTQDYKKGL